MPSLHTMLLWQGPSIKAPSNAAKVNKRPPMPEEAQEMTEHAFRFFEWVLSLVASHKSLNYRSQVQVQHEHAAGEADEQGCVSPCHCHAHVNRALIHFLSRQRSPESPRSAPQV